MTAPICFKFVLNSIEEASNFDWYLLMGIKVYFGGIEVYFGVINSWMIQAHQWSIFASLVGSCRLERHDDMSKICCFPKICLRNSRLGTDLGGVLLADGADGRELEGIAYAMEVISAPSLVSPLLSLFTAALSV